MGFDSKTNPGSPLITGMGHLQTPDVGMNRNGHGVGFATKDSIRNSVENTQNELYEYPNTYHLHGTPSINQNESKSDSNDDAFPNSNKISLQSRHSLKHIFKNKKSKKKNKGVKSGKYDSVNVYDSDHSSDLNHKSMVLPKHKTVQHVHSDPLHTNDSNSNLFNVENQPLMHSVSDPHIISHLPGAGNISDNSKGHKSYNQSQRSNKHLHQNPNYRLSQSNNLSNIPHPHHHFNDDDEDIRHSPRAHQVFHGIKERLTGHSKV